MAEWRRGITAVLSAIVIASTLGIGSIAVAQDSGYQLPAAAETALFVTQGNDTADVGGDHTGQSRHAYDFALAWNEPFEVAAARAGTVQDIRSDVPDGNCPRDASQTEMPACWSEVNRVVIDHGDGTAALYLHLAKDSSTHLSQGDQVSTGQTIGTAGASGWSSDTLLHFMVMSATPADTATPWWRDSIGPIPFGDASVRAVHPDGIPGAEMNPDGPFFPADAAIPAASPSVAPSASIAPSASVAPFPSVVPSTAVGPSGKPLSRPKDLPARVPWSAGRAHQLAETYDRRSPEGFGITVEDGPGDVVYPIFDGEVVFAGCAAGRSVPLGLMVVVRHWLDGHTYDAVFGHLSSVNETLMSTPILVGANDVIGTFGSVAPPFAAHTPACAATQGEGLYVGLLRDAQVSAQGEISGGRPVYPEPLIGLGAYEGLTWWDGPMTAIDLDEDQGDPEGRWARSSTKDGSQIQFGGKVTLVAKVSDDVPIREVRFNAYYPDWARPKSARRLDGFDPRSTWRIIAVCRPSGTRGEPTRTKGCKWDGSARNATVTFTWNPIKPALKKPAPWQPLVQVPMNEQSDQCVPVSFSFDVFDAGGYRRQAAAGAKRVEPCRGRTAKQGKVVNLQPMRPPAAPATVRLICPSRSVRTACVVEDSDAVTLQWQDRSNNETGFSIYARGSGLAGSELCTVAHPQERYTRWVRIATLPPGATSWRTSKASALQAAGVSRGAGSASLHSPSAHLRVASFNSIGQSALTGSAFLEDPFKDVYDCL